MLRTDGVDCFEEVPCRECGEPILVIYPDSVKVDKGEWPARVEAICPECRSLLPPKHNIPADEVLKHIDGKWRQYNFETKTYGPVKEWF